MAKRKKIIKILTITGGSLLAITLIAGNIFWFIKYNNLKQANLTTEQRIAKYEKEISKTYTLPIGDAPTLADVKSADELKKDEANKEFFKDAANGDILLIYSNNKLGVLYRPTTKKIIKAGPVAFKQQINTAVIGAKPDRDKVISTLKEAFANDIATATEADPKSPLTPGTIVVVDVTGNNKNLVDKLASELKGSVGNVPVGQDTPKDGTAVAIYVAPAN